MRSETVKKGSDPGPVKGREKEKINKRMGGVMRAAVVCQYNGSFGVSIFVAHL